MSTHALGGTSTRQSTFMQSNKSKGKRRAEPDAADGRRGAVDDDANGKEELEFEDEFGDEFEEEEFAGEEGEEEMDDEQMQQVMQREAMESDGVASLTKLKEMLDKGLITQADFDAKKAEILAKM